MAVSINTDGSQTAVISTEHTLATITTAGTFVLGVDLANLVGGDVLELRIKTKLRTSGGTSRLAYIATFTNPQLELMVYSNPVPSPVEFLATLKQTAGTGRAFDWAVYQL